jgi:sigma-E factor negative regulatory protein RseA
MTDPVKEQLSACLDGELPEAELDLLLKQVGRDSDLRASLGRYALIGETLRAKGPIAAPADFAIRVSAAIEGEPALPQHNAQTARPSKVPQWLRPVAGLAVAAGVAAVAILSLQPSSEAPETAYVAEVSAPVPETGIADDASYIVPAGTASDGGYVPAARLTNYVVAHSEYSGPLGRRSVLSGVLAQEEGEDFDSMDDSEAAQSTEDLPQQ